MEKEEAWASRADNDKLRSKDLMKQITWRDEAGNREREQESKSKWTGREGDQKRKE